VNDPAGDPTEVRLRAGVLDEMVEHARAEAPNECCGLLIGTCQQIDLAFRARNRRPGPNTYLIDPRDHFAAIKAARQAGAEVVGYYHSHPDAPPAPSATDRRDAVAGAHYYVIVTPGGGAASPSIAAFWLRHGNFQQVALVRVG
jgi:proteasome lid subunit RPN8/RPN11